MSYIHQAAPDLPPQTFSDRPVTRQGVRFIPRWNWSETYRKEFLKGLHNYGSAVDRANSRQSIYQQWLNKRGPVFGTQYEYRENGTAII